MNFKQLFVSSKRSSKNYLVLNIVLPYFVVAFMSLLEFFSAMNSHIYTKPVIAEVVINIFMNLWLVAYLLPKLRYALPVVYKVGMIFIIPTIILNMARIDLVLSTINHNNFSQVLNRVDAIYFSVTTLATIGAGNIYPMSQTAREWVTLQVIINFVIVGFVLFKLISDSGPKPIDPITKEMWNNYFLQKSVRKK